VPSAEFERSGVAPPPPGTFVTKIELVSLTDIAEVSVPDTGVLVGALEG
jgi:hypothetical protein